MSRWIRRVLRDDPPRARSLIVTVWGDALVPHGGAVWLAGLIRLMAPFGINERLTRTSVFRLARDGWLAAETHGRRSRYRLTGEGRARFAAAYRRIYAPPAAAWEGAWDVVVEAPPSPGPAQRAALRDELRWEGFGVLAPGVFARPCHGAASRYPADGGPPAHALQVVARDVDGAGAATLAGHVDRMWDLQAVADGYRRYLTRFGGVIDRFRVRSIDDSDPMQCFVVRTLLVHAFRRVLLRDPRLPPALLPLDWPGAAAFVLTRDFYRLTQARAEAHLAATLEPDGDALAPADGAFYARFGGLAP